MKNIMLFVSLVCLINLMHSQNTSETLIPEGFSALSFVSENADKKRIAKDISQFRSKEFIVKYIIGPTNGKEIQFETESLASDNSSGLISVAFNATKVDKRGLLLAFFGDNRNEEGILKTAYGFRYIPLEKAKKLLARIERVKKYNKEYITAENDVNNVYIEYEDIKFIIYRDGGTKIRILWNGFEVIWERVAFDRTKRRLERWFK